MSIPGLKNSKKIRESESEDSTKGILSLPPEILKKRGKNSENSNFFPKLSIRPPKNREKNGESESVYKIEKFRHLDGQILKTVEKILKVFTF